MAISMGAAILGAGVLGAGASAYGSSQASKAAGKAADQNAQIQQQQYLQTRADLSPYSGAGNAATAALMQRLGLSGGGATSGGVGAPANTGGAQYLPGSMTPAGAQGFSTADLNRIRQDWPGIEQEFQRASAAADRNSPAFQQKGLDSLDNYTRYWYDNMRNPADYSITPQGQQQAQPTGQPTGQQPSAIPGQTFDSANNGGMGQRPGGTLTTSARPIFDQAMPDYGDAPDADTYFDNFETDPGYQFRLNEGTRNLNASYGAKGLLKSDAAIRGITDYGQGLASQEYGNWWNRQNTRFTTDLGQYNQDRNVALAQWNQDRNVFNQNFNTDAARADQNNIFNLNRGDANWESDRAYNTNRYDAYTGNLFNLANIGQSAAAGQAGAGQNYAAAATANNNALASVKGNAAIAAGNGINNAINTGMQAYGMYQNPFAGAGSGGFKVGGWGF